MMAAVTVNVAGDAVRLPPAVPGLQIMVANLPPQRLGSFMRAVPTRLSAQRVRRVSLLPPTKSRSSSAFSLESGSRGEADEVTAIERERCTNLPPLPRDRRRRRDIRHVDQVRIEDCRLAIGGASWCPFGGIFGNPDAMLQWPRYTARVIQFPAKAGDEVMVAVSYQRLALTSPWPGSAFHTPAGDYKRQLFARLAENSGPNLTRSTWQRFCPGTRSCGRRWPSAWGDQAAPHVGCPGPFVGRPQRAGAPDAILVPHAEAAQRHAGQEAAAIASI
jgi:hypothetical protein